jgi:exosome complex component RRP4
VSNIIRVLATRSIPLTDALILEAYEWAIDQEGNVADLLQSDVGDSLVTAVTGR